ncbi:MAG: efflux RND transporter periplasmic adaptor subunit [Synergistaceae bacterium]|nr:efflux RND transporter periplasmic adaptor subunit [Synergistaceae bacterium]
MREKKEREPEGKLGPKIIYWASVVAIAVIWVVAFRSYFEQYDSAHPEIAWALPWVQSDTITASGVYLWNEAEVRAPASGAVSFPSGAGPLRVAKGAILAKVDGSYVRAAQEGYFLAGSDGMEGKWRYAALWPGYDELPSAPPVTMTKAGQRVKSGAVIGKLVLQPQDLRFIGYADLTGNLEEDLASNRVMVKMDALDTPSHAPVRVYERVGHRAKMYLTAPWFPPDVTLSRNCEMLIEAGTVTGVTVPESSVIRRDGVWGAFVLKGSEASFAAVEGRSISGNRFLVTSGVKLGDAVIVNGGSAREGRVRLW